MKTLTLVLIALSMSACATFRNPVDVQDVLHDLNNRSKAEQLNDVELCKTYAAKARVVHRKNGMVTDSFRTEYFGCMELKGYKHEEKLIY